MILSKAVASALERLGLSQLQDAPLELRVASMLASHAEEFRDHAGKMYTGYLESRSRGNTVVGPAPVDVFHFLWMNMNYAAGLVGRAGEIPLCPDALPDIVSLTATCEQMARAAEQVSWSIVNAIGGSSPPVVAPTPRDAPSASTQPDGPFDRVDGDGKRTFGLRVNGQEFEFTSKELPAFRMIKAMWPPPLTRRPVDRVGDDSGIRDEMGSGSAGDRWAESVARSTRTPLKRYGLPHHLKASRTHVWWVPFDRTTEKAPAAE